jgi:peptide subunit release factor 1 (eRF1)
MEMEQHQIDADIERIKMKRTLDSLDDVEGMATSMITVVVPRGGSLAQMRKKLECELATSTR